MNKATQPVPKTVSGTPLFPKLVSFLAALHGTAQRAEQTQLFLMESLVE